MLEQQRTNAQVDGPGARTGSMSASPLGNGGIRSDTGARAGAEPYSAIKPIETEYAGCLFRSRLEARWAVFFDQLGIRWEYEPEGFETPAGRYLPDFRIELFFPFAAWTWFEVKPDEAPDDRRHAAFVAAGNYLTIARGMPRNYDDQYKRDYLVTYDPPGRYGHSRVGFWAHANGTATTFSAPVEPNRWVDAAYRVARSAKFEHGAVIPAPPPRPSHKVFSPLPDDLVILDIEHVARQDQLILDAHDHGEDDPAAQFTYRVEWERGR